MSMPDYSLILHEFGVSAFIARTFFSREPDILNHFDIFFEEEEILRLFFQRALPQRFGVKFLPQDDCVRR